LLHAGLSRARTTASRGPSYPPRSPRAPWPTTNPAHLLRLRTTTPAPFLSKRTHFVLGVRLSTNSTKFAFFFAFVAARGFYVEDVGRRCCHARSGGGHEPRDHCECCDTDGVVSAYVICCTHLCRAVFSFQRVKVACRPPFLLLSSSHDKGRDRPASAGSPRPDRCPRSAMSSLPCVTVALCMLAHPELALTVTARAASTSGAPGAAGHRIHLHGHLRWCRLLVVSLPPRARPKERC